MRTRLLVVMLIAAGAACTGGVDPGPSAEPRPTVDETVETEPSPTARGDDRCTPPLRSDGWAVEVCAVRTRFGPLRIAVADLRRAPRNDARPWLQHDIVLRNAGRHPIEFDRYIRTSVMLPVARTQRLLVADTGCGYRVGGGRVSAGACDAYLDRFAIPPGRTEVRDVTLFKELPGMQDLVAGRYVFDKKFSFRTVRRAREKVVAVPLTYVISRS